MRNLSSFFKDFDPKIDAKSKNTSIRCCYFYIYYCTMRTFEKYSIWTPLLLANKKLCRKFMLNREWNPILWVKMIANLLPIYDKHVQYICNSHRIFLVFSISQRCSHVCGNIYIISLRPIIQSTFEHECTGFSIKNCIFTCTCPIIKYSFCVVTLLFWLVRLFDAKEREEKNCVIKWNCKLS